MEQNRRSGRDLGARLRGARKALGLTQLAAASQLGMSRATIVAWEAGTRSIAPDQLARLAGLYGASIAELLGSDDALVNYRARVMSGISKQGARLGAPDRASIARFFSTLDACAELRAELEVPSTVLPTERDPAALRKAYGLGTGPLPKRATEWLDYAGVFVYRVPLKDTNLHGFSCWHPTLGPAMLINIRTNPWRAEHTALHEFGHLVAERDNVFVSCRTQDVEQPHKPTERAASGFAVAFAVPEEGLNQYLAGVKRPLDPEAVVRMQRAFGVSFTVMLRRLRTAGLLSQHLYDQYKTVRPVKVAQDLGIPLAYGELRESVDDIGPRGRFPESFIALVKRASDEGVIGEMRAADLLQVNVDGLWWLNSGEP